MRRPDSYVSSMEHAERVLSIDWTRQHQSIVSLSMDNSLRVFSTHGQLLAKSIANETTASMTMSKVKHQAKPSVTKYCSVCFRFARLLLTSCLSVPLVIHSRRITVSPVGAGMKTSVFARYPIESWRKLLRLSSISPWSLTPAFWISFNRLVRRVRMIRHWHVYRSWPGVKMNNCVWSKWIIPFDRSITTTRDQNARVSPNRRSFSLDLFDRVSARRRWTSFRMKPATVIKAISKKMHCTISPRHRESTALNFQKHPTRTTVPLCQCLRSTNCFLEIESSLLQIRTFLSLDHNRIGRKRTEFSPWSVRSVHQCRHQRRTTSSLYSSLLVSVG